MKRAGTWKVGMAGMLLAMSWSGLAVADDLQKDPKFGKSGVVLQQTPPENYGTKFYDMIKLPNDKLVTGGITWIDGQDKLVLYRYDANGKLDTSFGNGGVTIADHVCNIGYEECGHFQTEPGLERFSVLLRRPSDGELIVVRTEMEGRAGYTFDQYPGVVGFKPNGKLDRSFGYHGGFGYNTGMFAGAIIRSGALQADGKIVTVGFGDGVEWHPYYGVVLARFTADGKVDTEFGPYGKGFTYLHVSADDYSDEPYDVTVQKDGKILVVGSTVAKGCGEDNESVYVRGLIARFDENGSLDTSFAGKGYLKFNVAEIFDIDPWDPETTNPCLESHLIGVAVQSDGKIVVLGEGWNSWYGLFLARFHPDGTLDRSFGYQGVRMLYNGFDYDHFDHTKTVWTRNQRKHYPKYPKGLRIKKDGSFVVVGRMCYGLFWCGHDIHMAVHFTRDGDFDRRYGVSGVSTIPMKVGDPAEEIYEGWLMSAVQQKSGKMVYGGWGTLCCDPSYGTVVRTLPLPGDGDFNGDKNGDLLWRAPGADDRIWYMGPNGKKKQVTLGVHKSMSVQARGDFDGDGKEDILWKKKDGSWQAWLMRKGKKHKVLKLNVPKTYSLKGVGDFNHDGIDDLLWRRRDGLFQVWYMSGSGKTGSKRIVKNRTMKAEGVGDFDGNGYADILWKKRTGQYLIWFYDENGKSGRKVLGRFNSLTLQGIGDFDSDTRSDLLWKDEEGGYRIWRMDAGGRYATIRLGSHPDWSVAGLEDIDGDGSEDIVWHGPADSFFIWRMSRNGKVAKVDLGERPVWELLP